MRDVCEFEYYLGLRLVASEYYVKGMMIRSAHFDGPVFSLYFSFSLYDKSYQVTDITKYFGSIILSIINYPIFHSRDFLFLYYEMPHVEDESVPKPVHIEIS